MEKSTKLIIAAIGLGGLGYFLYKKGLFAKTTTTEVAKDVKKVDDVVKDVVKEVVDTGKKTAVELTKDCVLQYYRCTLPSIYETIQIPIDADCGRYQPPKPPCAPPDKMPNKKEFYDPIGFRDNTYYDQPRIDYTSGKYNQELPDYYMGRDMDFIRNNRELFM
jgi:hypothetical protein